MAERGSPGGEHTRTQHARTQVALFRGGMRNASMVGRCGGYVGLVRYAALEALSRTDPPLAMTLSWRLAAWALGAALRIDGRPPDEARESCGSERAVRASERVSQFFLVLSGSPHRV